MVLIDALELSVVIFKTSPTRFTETDLPRVFPKKPASIDAGTATIPSVVIFAGITTSTPHSRFVARKINLLPSAVISTQPKTGRLDFFSEKRAAVEAAVKNVCNVVSNFICII